MSHLTSFFFFFFKLQTYSVNHKRTDALMIHGQHYFQNSNWLVALADFSSVLHQEPGHAEAR